MKTLTFSQRSLHWRLASYYGPLDADPRMYAHLDMCSYTRAVLLGLGRVAIIIFVLSVFSFFIGDALGWLAAMIVSWQEISPDEPAVVGAVVLALSLVLTTAILSTDRIEDFLNEREDRKRARERALQDAPAQRGFWSQAWRSLKERTCVRIRIE